MLKKAYIKSLGKRGKIKVFLVDGTFIRNNVDLAFTQGGHDLVYDWVPKNTIIIDDANYKERNYIIEHELHERNLMSKGMGYDEAHEHANGIEGRLRPKVKKLVGKLKVETHYGKPNSLDGN